MQPRPREEGPGRAPPPRASPDRLDAAHRVVFRDSQAYCAHPHLAELANGDWLLVFNQAPRGPNLLHPPHDPRFRNLIMRSHDQGESWSTPQTVPSEDWTGVECAGLTALADGEVLLNQWRFDWYTLDQIGTLDTRHDLLLPADMAREIAGSRDLGDQPPEAVLPWARGGGVTYVHRSRDGGRSWPETLEISTAPYSGGYGMRGAIALADGGLLLPLSDVPHYERVFVVRSDDRGASWSPPIEVAAEPGKAFEEPAPLALADGGILMLLRENSSRRLHQTVSRDGGRRWSRPRMLPFEGYPAHLTALPDGRVLCVYGHREPDFSIRAVVADQAGDFAEAGPPLTLRGGLPNGDLGYPSSLVRPDGSIFTVYYCRDASGVTGLHASTYRV